MASDPPDKPPGRELRRGAEPVDAAWAAWEEWEGALPDAQAGGCPMGDPAGGGAGSGEDERRLGRHFTRGHWRRLCAPADPAQR